MNFSEVPTLSANGVTLRPLAANDAVALHAILTPEVVEFIPDRLATLAEVEAFVARGLADEHSQVFAIIADGQFAGTTRICQFSQENLNAEVGYTMYARSVWRTKVNTTSKLLILTHAFEKLGLIRVFLKTDLRNLRSQRAMERLGCQHEGIFRNDRILPDGYVRSTTWYSVLSAEWPAMKERLTVALR